VPAVVLRNARRSNGVSMAGDSGGTEQEALRELPSGNRRKE
jgi:hypothetical protein